MKKRRVDENQNKARLERIIRKVGMPPRDPEAFEEWWEHHWQGGRGLHKLADAAGFSEDDLLKMFRRAEALVGSPEQEVLLEEDLTPSRN